MGRDIPQKCQHGIYVSGGDFMSDQSCSQCDAVDAVAGEAYELGAAWAEADEWHPSVWPTHLVDGTVAYWTATVTRPGAQDGWAFAGPTPAAALRSLAEKLRHAD